MKSLTLRAPAKINLYLDVLGKLKDNYHEIESIVQSVSVYDILYFEKIKQGIKVICDCPSLTCREDNLVYKAAKLFFSLTGLTPGVKITVKKEIPVGAGLGGGSSDAATTLLGLNILFATGIPLSDLINYSSRLGMDVPFCLLKGTALLKGKGDEVHPLPPIKKGWIVLVYPDIPISTSWVYSRISGRLTDNKLDGKLNINDLKRRIKSNGLLGMKDLLYNKLEEVVIEEFPLIKEIKEKFNKRGAKGVLMSGSGSTVFGLVEDAKNAQIMATWMQVSGKVYLAQPTEEKVQQGGLG
ncbi:4-(cytidine 5'-diphospho)-2-C-methyl-D-erythritol kinase [Candidatus Aerophobetes bacterium]|nr:4-(cytidine 5'-diphospho)-2-C-methyl-D-erythritol kinase [Candidatus Aerophobetes bacterium]